MLVREPKKKPASFPPAGFAAAHRVRTGEGFKKIAEKYHRSDLWDVIFYNFQTTEPREINWYLQEWVGCTASADGKNYSFSDFDDPGRIYIPPPWWRPGGGSLPPLAGESVKAKYEVLTILSSWPLNKIHFTYRSQALWKGSYTTISNAIIDNLIRVAIDPHLSTAGAYDSGTNVLYFRDLNFGSIERKALVVHEATHAILDRRGADLYIHESETAAYLAQAIYVLEHHGKDEVLTDPDPQVEHIFDVSRTVALELDKGKKIGELGLEIQALENAVILSDLYKKDAWKKAGFNGLY